MFFASNFIVDVRRIMLVHPSNTPCASRKRADLNQRVDGVWLWINIKAITLAISHMIPVLCMALCIYTYIYIYIYTYRTEINLCTCRQFANFLGKYRYQVTTSMYVLYVIPRFTLKRWDVNQAALNGNDHLRNGKRRARHWLLIFFVWMIFASTISYCRRIKHMIPKSPEREFGPKRFCECHICPSVTRKRGRCSFGG